MVDQKKKRKDVAEFQAKVNEYASSENNETRINILNQIPTVLTSIFQTDDPDPDLKNR